MAATAAAPRRRTRVAHRQARLAEIAESIATSAGKDLNDDDARALLRTIVRRWSEHQVVVYKSRAATRAAAVHREHVVPVRVLVDRMIAKPRTTRRLLRTAILLAEVTPAEHQRIGTMLQTHKQLYDKLKTCRTDELIPLSWQRYSTRGVEVFDEFGSPPA